MTCYKCDRCGKTLTQYQKTVLYVENANNKFHLDLCEPCFAAFGNFMKEVVFDHTTDKKEKGEQTQ